MGARAARGSERATARTAQDAFAPARAEYAWVIALCAGAVALLLLTQVRPAPVETFAPADLATQRDMAGFYAPESDALGNTYVWASREATAAFDLASRKPLTLTLDLRSAATVGGPDSPIAVRVNGREIGVVRPEPTRYDFASFRLRVPRSDTPLLRVTLTAATAIAPRPADGRTLAVMVRSVSLDRTEAWSTIARRTWLYSLVPPFLLLAAAGAALSRVMTRQGAAARLVGYAAVLAAIAGAAAMLAATALLLSIGEIDRGAYYLWLLGSAYLAALCAAVALALPFGAGGAGGVAGAPSAWRRATDAAFVRRHAPRLRLAAGVAALAGVALIAVGLLTYYGTGDVDRKVKWMGNVRAYGLVDAYARIPDQYPPLTLTILAAAGGAGDALRLSDFAAFKGSLLLFVALTAATLLLMTRNALLTAATTLALLPNALALGYTDIYFAPPLVGALWALRGRRWVAFSLCLALACLTKWQAAILAPPLLLAAARFAGERPHPPAPSPLSGEGVTCGEIEAKQIQALPAFPPPLRLTERGPGGEVPRLAALLLPGAGVAVLVLLIFGFPVLASLVKGMGERFLSANALNANWLLTHLLHTLAPGAWPGRGTIQSTDAALTLPPKLLFAAAYGFALLRLARGTPTFARAVGWSLAAYLAYFALNTGVHENHLFTAMILAAVLAAETGRRGRVVFALVALAANLNLVLFYGLRGEPLTPPALGPLDLAVILSALNVALIAAFFAWQVWAERRAGSHFRS